MNVSSATNPAMAAAEVSMTLLRKTLDMATDQNTRMLQSMPKAAGPSHLGQGIDLYM